MKENLPINNTYYKKNNIQKEMVLRRLQERGCRITKQRRVLLDVILEQDCTSCKEMYYKANAIDSTIGVSTVYRMVNLMEEIGVFSRKNMYKVSCCMDCKKENVCVIQFEDESVCQLTSKEWYNVISEGLKACEYGNGKKIVSVSVEPCYNQC